MQSAPASCSLAQRTHAVTRVAQQPEETMDERCGAGRRSLCYGSRVTRCTRRETHSPVLPCALRCPCLAAAPAGGCLSVCLSVCLPKEIGLGSSPDKTAVVTGKASSSHRVNLCDPAAHRRARPLRLPSSLLPLCSYLLSCQNDLKFGSACSWPGAELPRAR